MIQNLCKSKCLVKEQVHVSLSINVITVTLKELILKSFSRLRNFLLKVLSKELP